MNSKEFLSIEKKYDLLNAEVEGVQFWNYCRATLWNYNICNDVYGLIKKERIRRGLSTDLQIIKNVLFSNIWIPQCDILFFCHERRQKIEGFYEDIYTDKIMENFHSAASVVVPFNYVYPSPMRTRKPIYLDRTEYFTKLKIRIIKRLRKNYLRRIKTQIRKIVSPALKELAAAYAWNYQEDKIINDFTDILLSVLYIRKCYKKLLSKVKPKVIVNVVHYGLKQLIMTETAREFHIPVIELQHGTIYEDHVAYQYLLPTEIRQFPDYIFLFSEFWKSRMSVPVPEERLIATGYPHFEEAVRAYGNTPRKDDRYTIIFVSQKTIGPLLSEIAVALSRNLDNNRYRIIFKLHPTEYDHWRTNYRELEGTWAEVISDSTVSIYKLFAQSDMQIGVYSTALYEGLGFHLNTLIVKLGHYDAMEPLVSAGYARFVNGWEDIVKELGKTENHVYSASNFWKQNAMENIIGEICRICPEIKICNSRRQHD